MGRKSQYEFCSGRSNTETFGSRSIEVRVERSLRPRGDTTTEISVLGSVTEGRLRLNPWLLHKEDGG